MTVADREHHIISGAISFFAENGFNAQMRDLATAIGVTHTLVYHYFPTKQALLDRVYIDYARCVLTRDFVRLLIFSGLTDRSITDRFFGLLGERLFPRLIRETRRYRGSRSRARTTPREHELLMGLHGGVFYGGLRWFVYAQTVHDDRPALDDETVIADRVHGYLAASLALEPCAPRPHPPQHKKR
jgi:AcrR family transcriptional regulator